MYAGLTQNQNQMCGNYSQGNKRKLCTALALIGNFQVVLLDEPTSGVDVVSKQQLYEIITQSKQIGRTIVVSSHRYPFGYMYRNLLCFFIYTLLHMMNNFKHGRM